MSADEFYVGWQETAPPGFARRTRAAAAALLALGAAVGVLVAASQERLPPAVFEFGVERELRGTLVERPYPALRVARPGADAGFSRYLLVAPGKHGAGELAAGLDGAAVSLVGTLVHHDGRTMIEVVPGSIARMPGGAPPSAPESVGRRTLVGEIADSKCHLGVMNPGRSKVHRACATLCIAGGVPPLLLVDGPGGAVERYLLVSADGRAVNREVLPMVADRVEVTGEVRREDDLLVLYADPSTYRRRDR